MSQRDSSSSSESLSAFPDIPLCIICEEAASGVGPLSVQHLCQEHLAIDVADGRKLQRDVNEELRPYSEGVSASAFAQEQQQLLMELHEIAERFSAVQQMLDEWKARVTELLLARQQAVQTCQRDCDDIVSYNSEVASAEAAGDMASVCKLAMSMQVSVPDLQADFERAQRLRVESDGSELRGLRRLQRVVASLAGGADATDAAVTARPETSDAAQVTAGDAASDDGASDQRATGASGADAPVCGPIVRSHEVEMDGWVEWVAVCSDTSGFLGDSSGRVVPAESAGKGSVALPQPCLIAIVCDKDHLTVLSVDGTVRLRSHCDINWEDVICGLHCDRQLLFIAQAAAVTVTDLSGRVSRQIRPDTAGFGNIWGIGGNAASVFVSSDNKIAAFSKSTGQLETIITLSQLPDAELCGLVTHGTCILVTDWKHGQVHRVSTGTQQLVATHPTQRAGLARFERPRDVAVDGRGRLFVSEHRGHSVRAVAADDGSLLWTLGVPGESGSGGDRLNRPCGLAVVTGGPCEQLVVADAGNSRLLVLNLH